MAPKYYPAEAAIRGVLQKTALKNFAILTEKHLCWSFFLRKLQAFRLDYLEHPMLLLLSVSSDQR